MWKTALFLMFTLAIVPIITFQFDDPLSALQMASLKEVTAVYLVFAVLCFVVSSLTDNYSQVDKLWSIMPVVYAWLIAWRGDLEGRGEPDPLHSRRRGRGPVERRARNRQRRGAGWPR